MKQYVITFVMLVVAFCMQAQELKKGDEMPKFELTSSVYGDIKSTDLKGKVVLINLFATWCGPCKMIAPVTAELAEKYEANMKFTSLNTTGARRVAISQKVLGLPVMAIYKGGEKVEELVKEECTAEAIEAMIQKYV